LRSRSPFVPLELLSRQASIGEGSTTSLHLLRQQARRFGAGRGDVLKELGIRIIYVEELHHVHILDGDMILGTDVHRTLRPFKLHPFHGRDQRSRARIPFGCLDRLDQQHCGIESIRIEEIGVDTVAGFILGDQPVVDGVVRGCVMVQGGSATLSTNEEAMSIWSVTPRSTAACMMAIKPPPAQVGIQA
jgi:hypothetical protein